MKRLFCLILLPLVFPASAGGEQGSETLFATFSLCAVDPATQEVGVAVTTRVPFVGRAVPWVEAGVGGVATQSWTRVEYGREGLALLKQDVAPKAALKQMLASDDGRERRQVGLINMKGESAAHTGSSCGAWAGSRQGVNYTVQANIMVGPEVIAAVADHFEGTAASGMPLAERMILAMEAGQKTGGDKRWGRLQSAAIVIANPNVAGRGDDHISLRIDVGEHGAPVAEMKRIYYKTAERLGYRDFSRIQGPDVLELKRMLHALGYWGKDLAAFPEAPVFDVPSTLRQEKPEEYKRLRETYWAQYRAYMNQFATYDETAITAVDVFRKEKGLHYSGNPPGLVDARFVRALKQAYYARGK